jgi:hypothetical protein
MRAHRLAWVLWMATVSLVAGALFLGLANRPEVPPYQATSTIIAPTFATSGALISYRHPANVMAGSSSSPVSQSSSTASTT